MAITGFVHDDDKHVIADAQYEIERLRVALKNVVEDMLAYEHINNLAPNPGRKFCLDSVARAHDILNSTK